MISYYASSSKPAQIIGRQFICTNRQEIVNNKPTADAAWNVLLVIIEVDAARQVSIDVLHLDGILPMSRAAMALPPLSIRGDLGVLTTATARYGPSLLKSFVLMGPRPALGATKLLRPFSEVMDSLDLKDPFLRDWVDLLAFLLAGVKSNGPLSAEMFVENSPLKHHELMYCQLWDITMDSGPVTGFRAQEHLRPKQLFTTET